MIKLYGIPNCDTVKKARSWLENKKIDFTFVDFKKIPPEKGQLQRWSEAFGGPPANTKGVTYKKHKDVFDELTPAKKLDFLIEHSSMIKRPILEKGNQVLAFGFNEEEYQKLRPQLR